MAKPNLTFASSSLSMTGPNAPIGSLTPTPFTAIGKTIFGTDNNDLTVGGAGRDYLYGNDGNDILSGGAGNDLLFGGAGSDILYGGTGADFLSGGTGADTFVYRNVGESGLTTATADTISGFQSSDRIDVPDWMADRARTTTITTPNYDSLEDAVRITQNGFWGDRAGLPDAIYTQAVLYYNPDLQTGYLLMDLDCNGYTDTGVIITGLTGSLPANYLDTLLV